MGATSDLFLRKCSKPAFHHVDPGSAGGSEVHVEARALGQPSADRSGFVSAVVVQNQRDLQRGRDTVICGDEELAKLAAAMPAVTLADDGARLHVQCSQQRGRTVALVIMAAAFGLAGAQGQYRLGAVQGL